MSLECIPTEPSGWAFASLPVQEVDFGLAATIVVLSSNIVRELIGAPASKDPYKAGGNGDRQNSKAEELERPARSGQLSSFICQASLLPMSQQHRCTCQTRSQYNSNKGTIDDADEKNIGEEHSLANGNAGLPTFLPPVSILEEAVLCFLIESTELLWIQGWPVLAWRERGDRVTI